MTKIYIKLIAVVLALAISISVAVMASYAWFVLSESPTVSGIQVAIGGGNTILIAPDVVQVVDGVSYHYPGRFSDTLDFTQYDTYSYLNQLGGLTPVSTADGVHWFLPAYYSPEDLQVQLGQVPSGQLKDVSHFHLDDNLTHANLLPSEQEKLSQGSYIYLDFWVVSPGSDYTLRVSTGDDSGTFLMDLPTLSRTESGYDLNMDRPSRSAVASARVGFLAGTDRVTDGSMERYMATPAYNSAYHQLRGVYQEGDGSRVYGTYRFCIYEPNGDVHPANPGMDGSYVITNPVGYRNGQGKEVSVASLLAVQKAAGWTAAATGSGTELQQRFQAALLGMDPNTVEEEKLLDRFYRQYLQWQLSTYVDKGAFLKYTSDLYAFGDIVSAEELAQLNTAGAAEDVYIVKLERNVPQRIRMFVWLEGQDMDCVNGLNTGSFVLNIEFAGSNAES